MNLLDLSFPILFVIFRREWGRYYVGLSPLLYSNIEIALIACCDIPRVDMISLKTREVLCISICTHTMFVLRDRNPFRRSETSQFILENIFENENRYLIFLLVLIPLRGHSINIVLTWVLKQVNV